MEPLALTWTIAILIGSTCITVLGSILALQKKKPWGYLVNTSGLICFWLAALMPYLHDQPKDREISKDALMVKHVSHERPYARGLSQLLGTWIVSKPDGYIGNWTFRENGVVDSESGPGMGTWKVDPVKLQIRVDWHVPGSRLFETFDLRLDPSGASGESWSGSGVSGFKMQRNT